MARRDTKSAQLRPIYGPPSPEQIGKAAFLGFVTRLRDEDIARRLGIARRTLARWKQRSDYRAARVALDCSCRHHLAEQYGYLSDPTVEDEADED